MESSVIAKEVIDVSKFSSIMATAPHNAVSDKYQVISTKDVIDILDPMGWKPVNVCQRKARVEGRKGVQKHLVRLRHTDNLVIPTKINEVYPELVLTNSHDRSCSFTIRLGLFRLVCSNGLIVSDSMFEMHSLRHIGEVEEGVQKAVDSVIDTAPLVSARLKTFQQTKLNSKQQTAFAAKILQLRYPKKDIAEEIENYDIKSLLQPIRKEDEKPTLWNVLNILQEKMVKGTTEPYINTLRENGNMSVRRGKRTNNVDHLIKLNQGIWAAAEEFIPKAA